MLSRCLEEGGTLTSSLIPWNTCGAVMFAALGVTATQYAPYAFVNWLNPLMGIFLPIIGYSLLRNDPAAEPLSMEINHSNKVM